MKHLQLLVQTMSDPQSGGGAGAELSDGPRGAKNKNVTECTIIQSMNTLSGRTKIAMQLLFYYIEKNIFLHRFLEVDKRKSLAT